MTPEEEAQVKDQTWAEMRQRLGDCEIKWSLHRFGEFV
jgi:hypothetical protein